MRWSTLRNVVVVLAFAAGGCGFAPGATGSGRRGAATAEGRSERAPRRGPRWWAAALPRTATAASPGMNCAAVDQPLNKLPPDILIVLDASGSMNEDVNNDDCGGTCGAMSKWALLTPALNQVVMQTQGEVNWGLKLFADTDSTCGVSPNTVAVPIAANNAGADRQPDRQSDRRQRPGHHGQPHADAAGRKRRRELPQHGAGARTRSSSCWRPTASRTARRAAATRPTTRPVRSRR